MLSLVALISHVTNDGVFIWILFNAAFAIPWKSFEDGGFASLLSKPMEYLKLLDKVPKYEEPKAEPPMKSN